MMILFLFLGGRESFGQGVGISESSITPDASAILELRSSSRGFLLPRLAMGSIGSPVRGLLIYNGTTDGNFLSFYNGSWITLAPLSSPTFTGTVTLPTPFTIGAVSMTSTGTQLNYLNAATGTTGTTSSNLVFSTSPTLTTPDIGAATGTSLSVSGTLTAQATTNQLVLGTTNTTTINSTAPAASRVYTIPDFGANGIIPIGTAGNAISLTTTGATNVTLPTSGTLATTGVLVNVQVLTSGTTYTPTAGATSALVYVIGGGGEGGGAAANAGNAGGGGGAGGCVIAHITPLAASYTYSIGAGGTGGAATAAGNPGGATTFNGPATYTAGGGGGGAAGQNLTGTPAAGGTAGTATGGDINLVGEVGHPGVRFAAAATTSLTGRGGSTPFGNGGAGRIGSAGVGNNGAGYGAGGGGAMGAAAVSGGDGATGAVVVFEYR